MRCLDFRDCINDKLKASWKKFHGTCSFCRKRHRNESSPSPRQSPKRRRDHSPDSDAYNSGDDKSKWEWALSAAGPRLSSVCVKYLAFLNRKSVGNVL